MFTLVIWQNLCLCSFLQTFGNLLILPDIKDIAVTTNHCLRDINLIYMAWFQLVFGGVIAPVITNHEIIVPDLLGRN